MGLRCSLFGHAFEDAVTERDRETRGMEVLISVREVRRCSRCGTEQVIAENTEIRHLGSEERVGTPSSDDSGMADRLEEAEEPTETPPSEETSADPGEPEVEAGDESTDEGDEDISQYVDSAEADESPSKAEDEDVEILGETDEGPSDTDDPADTEADSSDTDAEVPDTEPESPGDEESAAAVDPDLEQTDEPDSADEPESSEDEPVTDDAIIIDNDAGAEDRESDIGRRELAGTGNMFDASAPERDEPATDTESPDAELTDYYDSGGSSQDEDPAEMIDADAGSDPEAHEPWPGEEPSQERSDDPGFQFGPDMETDTSEVGSAASDEPSGFTTEKPVDVDGTAEDTPPKAVVCPECGFETRGIGTSLRAGDICPECHNGYLAERR